MRIRLVISLLASIAAVPAAALAHGPSGPTGDWRAMPHPGGWQWGGRGWWGGSFRQPVRGFIMPSFWLSPSYLVSDWANYGFAEPGDGRRWVRYYDDAVLVDGRGMIYDSVQDVPWGRYSQGPVPAYVGAAPDAPSGYGADYSYGADDEVTWNGGRARSDRQIWAWPSHIVNAQAGSVVIVPAGSMTTIVLPSQSVVTTTTTTYYENGAPAWRAAPRTKIQPRSYSKPKVIGRVPVKKS